METENKTAQTTPIRARGQLVAAIVLSVLFSGLLLFVHFRITHNPPEGTVPTGLYIPDSALFIYSMRMFSTKFESLYATCQSAWGTHAVGYYPLTYLWIYGGLGKLADALGCSHPWAYMLATWLGASAYLISVYLFLRQTLRKTAGLAFILFLSSGGLGGIAYLLCKAAGLTAWPMFEGFFMRWGLYELFEGPHLPPLTYLPRLYYTLSLAACFGALTLAFRQAEEPNRARLAATAGLLFAGTLINARFGIFTLAIVFIHTCCRRESIRRWPETGVVLAVAVAAASLLTRALLKTNPVIVGNMFQVADMAMWFSPFVSAIALHILLAPGEAVSQVRRLPAWLHLCGHAAMGYLIAYAALYCLYQIYYGNILICRDGSVAARISDPALLGAVVAAARSYRSRGQRSPDASGEHGWIALWMLSFLAIAISGFGQGWFLRFGPQRLQVFLWLPICMLSAMRLQAMMPRRPALAKGALVALCACGTLSTYVAVAFFQTPGGRVDARGPYASLHAEAMSKADDRMLEYLGEGRVLSLPPMSDAIVLQRGNPVIYGIGSFNLTDKPYVTLRADAEQFFSPKAADEDRRRIVRAWCADFVYCADTWPVAPETVEQLEATPWLEEIATDGRAALFRVVQ